MCMERLGYCLDIAWKKQLALAHSSTQNLSVPI